MNTLQDLRATLDHHAHDVHDDPSVARVAAVQGRARRVRRQRAGGVVVAAALAVAGVVLVPSLGGGGPQPAAAPDTLSSLGWTYRLGSTGSDRGRVVQELGASETPRLVSWATRGADQRVVVRQPGATARTSAAADYDDFAWVPPGPETTVRLTAAAGGDLDVAVYEVDATQTPPGVGEGVLTFREDVAGMTLLGATLGEPGDASIEVDVTPMARRMVWLASTCGDLPRGVRVHYAWADEEGSLSSGACDSGSSFDPGGSPNTGFRPGRHAERPSTLRMWLTHGEDSPVADGELPDVRLGLGAYSLTWPPVRVAGTEMADEVEHEGRVWNIDTFSGSEVSRNGRLPSLTVPDEHEHYLVREAVRARGPLRYSLTFDGRRVGSTFFGMGGAGAGGLVPVDPGTRVSLKVGTPLDRLDEAGITLYRPGS